MFEASLVYTSSRLAGLQSKTVTQTNKQMNKPQEKRNTERMERVAPEF